MPDDQPAPQTTTYSTLRIDRTSPDLSTDLAPKYRALRLYALRTSPEAFGSTHAIESAWPLSFWTSRLSRPNIEHLVTIAHLPNGREEWVAQVTLIGPVAKADYELPPEAHQPIGSDDEETRWHITALYASDKDRGKGVARMVCQAGFDFAKDCDRGKKARVRIMAGPDNEVALGFYEKLGLQDAGRVTRREAMKANGDEFLISEAETLWVGVMDLRFGIIMDVVL